MNAGTQRMSRQLKMHSDGVMLYEDRKMQVGETCVSEREREREREREPPDGRKRVLARITWNRSTLEVFVIVRYLPHAGVLYSFFLP